MRKKRHSRGLLVAGILATALILSEVLAGYLYFLRGSDPGPALAWIASRVGDRLGGSAGPPAGGKRLTAAQSQALHDAMEQAYRSEFQAFHIHARKVACHFMVVYQPSTVEEPAKLRSFFRQLSRDSGTELIDATQIWATGTDNLFLSGDMHPGRYANTLLAAGLRQRLAELEVEGCPAPGPVSSGPWPSGVDEIRETFPGRPYRFSTDDDGYRQAGASTGGDAPATILMIGDSFLFGTSLSDADSLPAQLAGQLPAGWRVLNAGVGGTTIVQQRSVLTEATDGHRPTVLLLFVNDTDLRDLLPLLVNGAGWMPENQAEFDRILAGE